ncbi:hypothetical protein [Paraliomyxa miuraensis]|uniref:hypothetical protein n=1 Tax=Paraliomyxa miuraensis TaxID=376150 RepID=UPI002258591E|nr:hypothetical protein [Paraliomyxa miuraensis]MCX4246206.1 hypothetical protein [Paraliomyxa miuraensis]
MDRHFLQVRANYCVPACIVMVEAWRGTLSAPPDERQHEIFDQLAVNGLCALEDAARLLPHEGVGEPDIDPAHQAVFLGQRITAGRRAIVTCRPGLLGQILAPRKLSSPHGTLTGNTPHHAIYVFGAEQGHFDVYDPWHFTAGQPLRLSRAQLARAWTGMMLIATK